MRSWFAGSSGSNDPRQFSRATIQAVRIFRANNELDPHVEITDIYIRLQPSVRGPYRLTSDSKDEPTAARYRKAGDCW
jgi:hypothetical protein